jgi:hypothetical protein
MPDIVKEKSKTFNVKNKINMMNKLKKSLDKNTDKLALKIPLESQQNTENAETTV